MRGVGGDLRGLVLPVDDRAGADPVVRRRRAEREIVGEFDRRPVWAFAATRRSCRGRGPRRRSPGGARCRGGAPGRSRGSRASPSGNSRARSAAPGRARSSAAYRGRRRRRRACPAPCPIRGWAPSLAPSRGRRTPGHRPTQRGSAPSRPGGEDGVDPVDLGLRQGAGKQLGAHSGEERRARPTPPRRSRSHATRSRQRRRREPGLHPPRHVVIGRPHAALVEQAAEIVERVATPRPGIAGMRVFVGAAVELPELVTLRNERLAGVENAAEALVRLEMLVVRAEVIGRVPRLDDGSGSSPASVGPSPRSGTSRRRRGWRSSSRRAEAGRWRV